ncbi:hypothetical protein LQF12_15800 [Ruania suaedae]|uniref:copper homeostasis protein CutC n=1 Tax=Ruania suaedae TaxID=2897774 RepID=UPI001E638DD6|nr:copper homeostasis protein CutC [Ruania suaedae]UFU02925.1 hypothetical protein LQF12_15800 [Ruania suaedae]
MTTLEVELSVQDPAGVTTAAHLHPDRIELCAALDLGGLTPSAALIDAAVAAREAGGPEVHVLIRPRAGHFHYSKAELDVILADCRDAVARGADGVVVGAATADGQQLDLRAIEAMVAAAGGRQVTVHRVLDTVADPVASAGELRGLGVTRLLTSGGAATAVEALEVLRAMVEVCGQEIAVMAGSGVRAETVPDIAATGVRAVHASAGTRQAPAGASLALGSTDDGSYATTDVDLARRFIAAARALTSADAHR